MVTPVNTTELGGCAVVLTGGTTVVACVVVPVRGCPIGDSLSSSLPPAEGPADEVPVDEGAVDEVPVDEVPVDEGPAGQENGV